VCPPRLCQFKGSFHTGVTPPSPKAQWRERLPSKQANQISSALLSVACRLFLPKSLTQLYRRCTEDHVVTISRFAVKEPNPIGTVELALDKPKKSNYAFAPGDEIGQQVAAYLRPDPGNRNAEGKRLGAYHLASALSNVGKTRGRLVTTQAFAYP
jgi:hypothetical protein